MLQILAAYLRDEGDGGAKDDRQFALRRQLLYDAQRDARFAGSAWENDFAARLTNRQSAAFFLLMLF